jgi:hypothetical protein
VPASIRAGPRLVTIEQCQAELLLNMSNRVADRGRRAPEPATRRRKTARLDYRKENSELIKAGHARILHFKALNSTPSIS